MADLTNGSAKPFQFGFKYRPSVQRHFGDVLSIAPYRFFKNEIEQLELNLQWHCARCEPASCKHRSDVRTVFPFLENEQVGTQSD